ncbi:probable ATP-dependent helicase PF08_0048 [Apis florea]|uniref:probable ATP-dependent helicase PF08_0048 n=1 Tax=Apis florea TaxID=7463 RepID=UPI000629AB47|nr:probable ATP-dependent helicase PF08_0048 [Apis florea]
MSVKNIWSVGVFLLVLFVIIGTSILHERKLIKQDYREAVEPDTHDYVIKNKKELKLAKIETIDGKKSRTDDFEIKAAPTFRIPPHRMWHVVGIHSPHNREYRSIVEHETDKGIDVEYKGRAERNTSQASSNEFKDTKKSYKKLKLIRTRADYKKEWKNKEQLTYSNDDKSIGVTKKTIGRRHADYFADRMNRSRRYARDLKDDKSDYYSMRKAVMDKFYARQKEIAKKYAKEVTTTHKPTYNLQQKLDKNNTSSFAKIKTNDIRNEISPKITTNNIQSVSSYAKIGTNNVQKIDNTFEARSKRRKNFDENSILISTYSPKIRKQAIETTTISSDTDRVIKETSNVYHNRLNNDNKVNSKSDKNDSINDNKNDDNVLKWGICSGKLIYQHNLIIDTKNSIQSNMDLTTTLEGSLCVTCIRIVPVKNKNATLNIDVNRNNDGSISSLMFIAKGLKNMEFLYVIKIWAVRKINDRCDHVET